MKKIISKILIIFIVMVILFEFVYSSNISYAFDSEDINSITNLIGGIVSIILWIPRILTTGMAWITGKIMTESLAESCGINDTIDIFKGTEGKVATPFDIFFNKYKLFDVNFFDITTEDNIINTIRIQVAQWFYAFRTFAAAILLAVLIYVGIRMAISTIAEDKAKYKKMLFDWCSSLALVFVLQYIAVFTIYANNAIVNFLRDYISQNGGEETYNQINTAIESIMDLAMGGMGIGSIVATFVYCMIIFQTIAFMLTYIQRMLKVGFLLIIAPLISITYSIDKMGDGKAQALNSWLKEYVYTILIQPFHCIMYLAFVNTAMKLLGSGATISDVMSEGLWDAIGGMNQLANGFLAILCLKFINDGEKAIRKIFNFQDDSSMTSLAAGAAVGMAALANAKKIGQATGKGINTAKGGIAKFGKAIGNDKAKFAQWGDKLKNTQLGKGMQKIGNKATEMGNAIKNSGLAQGINKIGTGVNDFVGKTGNAIGNKINDFKTNHPGLMKKAKRIGNAIDKGATTLGKGAKFVGEKGKKVSQFAKRNGGKILRRSMPLALGMMGAAMSYATGTSGAMEAIGMGAGLQKGSEQFFESTMGTMANDSADNVEKIVEAEYQEEVFDKDNDIRQKENELAGIRNTEKPKLSAADIEQMTKDQKQIAEWEAKVAEPDLGEEATPEEKEQQEKEKELATAYLERAKLGSKEGKNEFKQQRLNSDHIEESAARTKSGKEDLVSKKNEILQKILELKAARENIAKQEDAHSENMFTDKDVSSADRTMKSITDSIDQNVIGAGGSKNISDILKRTMGLDDDGSDEYQAIMAAAMDYRKASLMADRGNIISRAGQVGIEPEALEKETFNRVYGANG